MSDSPARPATDIDRLERKARRASKLALAAFSVLFVLACMELGVRLRDLVAGDGFFSTARNPMAAPMKPLRPFRTFGVDHYVERDGRKWIRSRHGEIYPFRKPAGTTRIVCFGGSTTEGGYPRSLEGVLRNAEGRDDIEVINVAYSAYATPHSLIVLALDVLSWQADLAILSHNVNDLTASYFHGFRVDYSNKYACRFYSVPDYRWRFTTANALFQHSQAYWVLRNALWPRRRRKVKRIRRRSLGDVPLPQAKAAFERNLRSFATLAKSNGLDVLFASQPLQPDEDMAAIFFLPQKYDELTTYPLHGEFVQHHQAYNRAVAKVAQEMGVWFIDSDAELGGRREYFKDSVHYTDVGTRRLAESLGRALRKQILPSLAGGGGRTGSGASRSVGGTGAKQQRAGASARPD